MQERFSAPTQEPVLLPPCCGTGCAVCVLDYVDEYRNPGLPQEPPPAPLTPVPGPVQERTQCCNTGCLVCVRDYPELFLQTETESHMLQLLEAVEQAQLQAAQLGGHLAGEQR